MNKNNILVKGVIFIVILMTAHYIFFNLYKKKEDILSFSDQVLLINTLDYLKPGFSEELREICTKYNINLVEIRNEEVDVKLFKGLKGNYKIVFLRLHCTNSYDQTWLFTGEKYDQNKYTLELLTDQIHRARPYVDEGHYFCVTSTYIELELESELIFIMGCDGVINNDLSSMFLNSGIKGVAGWNGPVDLRYSDKVALEICELILSGQDIKNIENFFILHDPDPSYHTQLLYIK